MVVIGPTRPFDRLEEESREQSEQRARDCAEGKVPLVLPLSNVWCDFSLIRISDHRTELTVGPS